MIGIILAGGSGTRLSPLTNVVSKQLLPVYDKPMIYYPITTLMLAGIRDFVIVVSPEFVGQYRKLLGDGSQWGINFNFVIQPNPGGIAQSFQLVPPTLREQDCALILGDNLFYGMGLGTSLQTVFSGSGALVFAYEVSNPKDYGVISFDMNFNPIRIQEKPTNPETNYAIPGLYFFNKSCYQLAEELIPSARGELEITDLLNIYLSRKELRVQVLARGTAWLDTGSPENLLSAATFVQVIEERQGQKIGCPEEVALREGYISLAEFENLVQLLPPNSYRSYLENFNVKFRS
jgi:glucose-1-phosphate thymidylyltransferase